MSKNMDEWRNFFNTANGDIFQVIENGILIAAFDCPNEFKLRRDRIAEVLFNCRYTQCVGCDRIELAVPAHPSNEDDDEHGHGRAVKANSDDLNKVNSTTRGSNFSYDEAEALTEELEEEKRDVDEVLRIREILRNNREESKESLFESLRRLELMGLSVRTLEVTHIGKAVSGLKKHGSLQIREFAKSLVDSWKALYTEYYNAREAVKGKSDSPDSVNPPTSNEEEEELGLPSPPLDDFGAFLDVQTTSMELSKFFEGMDEDGNVVVDARQCGEFDKAYRNRRKSMPEMRNAEMERENIEKRKSQPERIETVSAKDKDSQQSVKQETVMKQSKPCNTMPEVRMTPNLRTAHKVSSEMKLQQKPDGGMLAKRSAQQEKSKGMGEVVDERLAAAKKRLQENYQQAENAKKQRTIQVMELSDIPKGKGGFSNRNVPFRPGNHNRQRLINGRH